MKPYSASFVTSAADKTGWPETNLPEVVVVGRSNVGKSSFINAICNRKRLAYVGSTPGKTQLINFFSIDNDRWMLVDVPGYGYANLSHAQLAKMGKMMDEYFEDRKELSCVICLVDSRHAPSADDEDMIEYFKHFNIPVIIAATKIDKVPKTKRASALKVISQSLHIRLSDIYPVSSVEKTGFEAIQQALEDQLKKAETKSE